MFVCRCAVVLTSFRLLFTLLALRTRCSLIPQARLALPATRTTAMEVMVVVGRVRVRLGRPRPFVARRRRARLRARRRGARRRRPLRLRRRRPLRLPPLPPPSQSLTPMSSLVKAFRRRLPRFLPSSSPSVAVGPQAPRTSSSRLARRSRHPE